MKRGVDIAVERGFKVHIHLDGDMTLVLDRLAHIVDGLPRGMVMLDFEKTDMKKAKQVLGDKVCIYGNVPAAMLCFGAPQEVETYCRRLIDDCAPGGGFILGTECEVPWNAKPENVRTIIETAVKYGQY
jgi:uroporphyrinogen-III decarboxylase